MNIQNNISINSKPVNNISSTNIINKNPEANVNFGDVLTSVQNANTELTKAPDVVNNNDTKKASLGNEKVEDKKLKEACSQLESFFINMIFKNMRNSIDKSNSLFGDDTAMNTFTEMRDEEFAKQMSKKGIGISDVLYKQLSKKI